MIPIEPTLDKAVPDNFKPQVEEDLSNHARVMGNTALLLNELGGDETFEMTEEDVAKAAEMMQKIKVDGGDDTKATKNKDMKARAELKKPGVALAIGGMVSYYDQQVIQDKVQLRNIAVNKFLEIMQNSDDEKNVLKAAELLGKAGDLFTDKSEITITHKSSDELKDAIRERIQMLMQMQTAQMATANEKRMGELDVVDVETKEVQDNDAADE